MKNLTPLIIRALSLSLLLALTAWAQSGALSGKVVDQTGAAVAGATIKAISLASGRETIANADGNGAYQLTDLAAGPYRVSADAPGFGTTALNVTISGSGAKQDFTLSPGSIGDTITVTAGKGSARVAAETPQTVTVVTAGDLEQRRPASIQFPTEDHSSEIARIAFLPSAMTVSRSVSS